MERIDTHTRRSRVIGQKPEEIAAHDLGLLLWCHCAIERGLLVPARRQAPPRQQRRAERCVTSPGGPDKNFLQIPIFFSGHLRQVSDILLRQM